MKTPGLENATLPTVKTLRAYYNTRKQVRLSVHTNVSVSKSEAARALKTALGQRCRLWENKNGTWDVGFELQPGRQVVASGNSMEEALRGTYEWLATFSEKREHVNPSGGVVPGMLAAGIWHGADSNVQRDALARIVGGDEVRTPAAVESTVAGVGSESSTTEQQNRDVE